MPNLVEVQDLKKYFKTASGTLHAVDGINFRLEAGKTLGVVGESGCGKSTLGRVILGLLDSTDGKIFFDDLSGSVLLAQSQNVRARYHR